MKNKKKQQDNITVNVFFDETGISILELLESDFKEYVNQYIKLHVKIIN